MPAFGAASRLARGMKIDTSTARQMLDDIGQIATEKGDEYVYEIIRQPERAAQARAKGYQYLGGGALTGGALTGGGLAYKGHLDRQSAAQRAQTQEEKLKVVSDVLNDGSVNSGDKADILNALSEAGVFTSTEQKQSLWQRILGGENTRPGNSLAASLNPIEALGGGMTGTVLTVVLIWAAVQIWRDR